jgi:hypothetical protein
MSRDAGDPPQVDPNAFSAQGYALGGGKDTGGAGSAAVNVLVMNTGATVNDNAVLISTDGIDVQAEDNIALLQVKTYDDWFAVYPRFPHSSCDRLYTPTFSTSRRDR